MKIYHYESFYKFYTHSEEIEGRLKGQGLPGNSTDICPPFDICRKNEIPVFDNDEWIIAEDTFWRPSIVEVNYDAGRLMSGFQYEDFSLKDFPQYPNMPQLCNTFLVTTKILQNIRVINKKFNYCLALHKRCLSNKGYQLIDSPSEGTLALEPTCLYELKSELESIVFMMRRILDSLVQLTDLLVNFSSFEQRKKLHFESVGTILNPKKSNETVVKIILGVEEYEEDSTNFLSTSNQLFNGFKHTLMHDETTAIIGAAVPTILGVSVQYSNHKKKIYYHNHNAYHIMMGFQDTIRRIIKNQILYMTNGSTRTR